MMSKSRAIPAIALLLTLLLLLTGCARFSANDIAEVRYQNGVTSQVNTYQRFQRQELLAMLSELPLDEPVREMTERPKEGTYIYHLTLRDDEFKDLNHIWILDYNEIVVDGQVYHPGRSELFLLVALIADDEDVNRDVRPENSARDMFSDFI